MAKLSLVAGTTSKTAKVFIQDSSVTTGAGLTGLVFNTASLTAYYIREGASSATVITLVTATLGTWTTSGFIVVDGTNMPGLYEIGIPNAAIAAGAKSVVIYLKGATNMAQTLLEIELTAFDNQTANVTVGTTASTATNIKKNTASQGPIPFLMTDSSNHNPATGKTVTTTIDKDGAGFGAAGGTVAETSAGVYWFTPSQADTNCRFGVLRFTATACDDSFEFIVTDP